MNYKTNKNKISTRNNNRQKIPMIPTKLQMTIETNLPEYKKFKYDPVLTLPNAPSHNIYFNPLQPLDANIIRKIPENSRILSFFNSQMFHKLNGYTALFRRPLKTLEEASPENVNHNIQITLDTLFPTNGVFYIHREKYYIEFFEWQKGNWYLETSEPNKYTEEELYGPNYEIPESNSVIKKGGARTRKNNYSYGRTPYSYRNRSYKKRVTKYLTGPKYQIRLFLSLKKGEKLTEEELQKMPCKKQWKDITHSYTTVASDMKKSVKNTVSSLMSTFQKSLKLKS